MDELAHLAALHRADGQIDRAGEALLRADDGEIAACREQLVDVLHGAAELLAVHVAEQPEAGEAEGVGAHEQRAALAPDLQAAEGDAAVDVGDDDAALEVAVALAVVLERRELDDVVDGGVEQEVAEEGLQVGVRGDLRRDQLQARFLPVCLVKTPLEQLVHEGLRAQRLLVGRAHVQKEHERRRVGLPLRLRDAVEKGGLGGLPARLGIVADLAEIVAGDGGVRVDVEQLAEGRQALLHLPAAECRDALEIEEGEVVADHLLDLAEAVVRLLVQPVLTADGGDLVQLVRVLRLDGSEPCGDGAPLLAAVLLDERGRVRREDLHVVRLLPQQLVADPLRLVRRTGQKVGNGEIVHRRGVIRGVWMHAAETALRLRVVPLFERLQAVVHVRRIVGVLGRPGDAEAGTGRLVHQLPHLHVVFGRDVLVVHHLVVIIHRLRHVAEVVIAGGEPLIGVHRLVLRADVQKAEPVVRRVLVLLHAVVRFREVGVLVRARAVHLQRLVQQAQRGNIILFVQLRLRHVQQGVGAQVEPYLSFIHRILVLM